MSGFYFPGHLLVSGLIFKWLFGKRSAGQAGQERRALIVPLWKPAAIADRKRITTHIAKDNLTAAIEMGDMLIEKADDVNMLQQPNMGRPEYRLQTHRIEVIRLLHSSQQWP